MKWQNIRAGKCPKCGGKLGRGTGMALECDECEFVITAGKLAEIIADRSHPIHTYESPDESQEVSELFYEVSNKK